VKIISQADYLLAPWIRCVYPNLAAINKTSLAQDLANKRILRPDLLKTLGFIVSFET
jgi:hypothetical protein